MLWLPGYRVGDRGREREREAVFIARYTLRPKKEFFLLRQCVFCVRHESRNS